MILCLHRVLATFLDSESHFIRLVYLVFLFLRLGGIQDIFSRGTGVTQVCGIGYCSSTTEISINYAAAYKQYGNDTISVVPFFTGPTGFYTSNLDVARQVISGAHKSSFFKHENSSRAFLWGLYINALGIQSNFWARLWGMNLVAADGDTWRKHRRVMGPAFNNTLSVFLVFILWRHWTTSRYDMVWSETMKTYKEMNLAEGWNEKKEIEIPVIQKLTFQVGWYLPTIGALNLTFS